ncbi:DUF3142 domain-containing protein [Acetobacteraceae bacterium KSS8]|uniref:DUF3142 domain-containing protein n=1 Tax=Endosaccharibacter trunci TaxID=2812733 RepID=A0ABT1W391_9PROT|nr:DUF3142 domain-containing protein [Acetobacteraceae bacterium KSS8]
MAGFRVLVAEWPPEGRVVRPAVDWPALDRTGRPVTAVLRVDGSGALPDPASIAAAIPVGRHLAGIEIDFDCPTRRLGEYRSFLLALRPVLPRGLRLGITALPDWLRSSGFTALTRAVDQPVLQLHATDDPRDGLFDAARMRRRVRAMSRLSARPFLVSLPSYGVRVVLDPNGQLRATEAERSLLMGGAGRDLFVSPGAMARAVAWLERDPPFRLAGLVWFRVPTGEDRRSWSPGSWCAVLARQPAEAVATLERESGEPEILRLANRSDLDAPLPDTILLDAACLAADGAGPYRRDGSLLRRIDGSMMPAHSVLTVGWERCPAGGNGESGR